MQLAERVLYHQIHPVKLLTDIGSAALTTRLFWEHHVAAGLVVGFLPSIVVSALLIRWGSLERYRQSRAGAYLRRYMTRQVEMARFAGLLPLWGGAWLRQPLLIALGAAWIVVVWLWGLRRSREVADF